jgi:hypothetical protein
MCRCPPRSQHLNLTLSSVALASAGRVELGGPRGPRARLQRRELYQRRCCCRAPASGAPAASLPGETPALLLALHVDPSPAQAAAPGGPRELVLGQAQGVEVAADQAGASALRQRGGLLLPVAATGTSAQTSTSAVGAWTRCSRLRLQHHRGRVAVKSGALGRAAAGVGGGSDASEAVVQAGDDYSGAVGEALGAVGGDTARHGRLLEGAPWERFGRARPRQDSRRSVRAPHMA